MRDTFARVWTPSQDVCAHDQPLGVWSWLGTDFARYLRWPCRRCEDDDLAAWATGVQRKLDSALAAAGHGWAWHWNAPGVYNINPWPDWLVYGAIDFGGVNMWRHVGIEPVTLVEPLRPGYPPLPDFPGCTFETIQDYAGTQYYAELLRACYSAEGYARFSDEELWSMGTDAWSRIKTVAL